MEAGKRARARPLGTDAAAAFLGELEVSGNVLRAAAAAGVGPWTAYRRRARDADFAEAWDAALARARARIAGEGGRSDTVTRRYAGRPRLTAPRANEWTARTERAFLDHLSLTANVRAAAEAAGVSASGAWLRRRRMPDFAQAWAEAVEDGHARIELLLMERGAEMLGGDDEEDRGGDGAARAAFDPQIAMWLLKRQDQRRAGTVRRGRAWEREVPIEEVRASIMRKVEAMARANARGLRGGDGGGAGQASGGGAEV